MRTDIPAEKLQARLEALRGSITHVQCWRGRWQAVVCLERAVQLQTVGFGDSLQEAIVKALELAEG